MCLCTCVCVVFIHDCELREFIHLFVCTQISRVVNLVNGLNADVAAGGDRAGYVPFVGPHRLGSYSRVLRLFRTSLQGGPLLTWLIWLARRELPTPCDIPVHFDDCHFIFCSSG